MGNIGTYTLNYQCGVQQGTPLTYPHEVLLTINQLRSTDPGSDELEDPADWPPIDKALDTNNYFERLQNLQK